MAYLDDQGPSLVSTDDPATQVPFDSTVTPVLLSGDLALSMAARGQQQQVSVTLTLASLGPVASEGVVQVTLPSELTVVSSQGTGVYKANGKWKPGLLKMGKTAELELVLEADASLRLPVRLAVEASLVSATVSDPVAGNDAATAMVTITSSAAQTRQGEATEMASVSSIAEVPTEYALGANYPNPFNPETRIGYALPESGEVRLEVFDVLGRRVSVLVSRRQEAGRYEVVWDGSGLPSGLYVYRVEAGSYVSVRTMTLLK